MNERAAAMIERSKTATLPLAMTALLSISGAAACSDDSTSDKSGDSSGATSGGGGGGSGDARYAVSSVVSTPDSKTGYVNILSSLTPTDEEASLAKAYEFAGSADMWTYGGSVFVSDGESPTITKFAVANDGKLVEGATISFVNHGLPSTAFWNNTFISETKAYMINGVAEYVIWNPTTMEITGTLALPKLEPRGALLPRAASTDRGNVVYNGRLYQPMYWTDASYADRAPDSQIAVFDVETDKFIALLDAPCPGLDIGTVGDSGNLYFSNFTGGVGTHLVLGTAPNCVAKFVPATSTVSVAFNFADVAEGHEGAIFHYAGGTRFTFSVFHEEKVDISAADEPFGILAGLNWQIWSYDSESGKAAPIEKIDWNSGAAYWFQVDGKAHALIPAADYGSSTVYDVGHSDEEATQLFDVDGYGIRLFRVR